MITETAGTISHADYLSGKVALHFNVNYWRPFLGGSCSEAALSAASAARMVVPGELAGLLAGLNSSQRTC